MVCGERALWFAAYHDAMEIILLLALFAANSDPKISKQLKSFLAFYRENRDLISLMTKNGAPMPATGKSAEKEERRTENTPGAEKILEEYLSRLG